MNITGPVTKETIVQIQSYYDGQHYKQKTIALSNYGRLYVLTGGKDWKKIKDIPFKELNEEK